MLPLADALQNTLQNLTSRLAGVNNEQVSGRAMGIGAMLGYSVGTIKEQFKTQNDNVKNGGATSNHNNNNSNDNSTGSGLQGFISRAKSIVSPTMNMTDEKAYDGNTNPIRNVIQKEKSNNNAYVQANTISRESNLKSTDTSNGTVNNVVRTNVNAESNNTENENKYSPKKVASKVAKTGFNATKAYVGMGAKLAEGDFSDYKYQNNRRKQNNQNGVVKPYRPYNKTNDVQTTEYLTQNNSIKDMGDDDAYKEEK